MISGDTNTTSGSNENVNDSTAENTRGAEDFEQLEEHKRMEGDSTIINDEKRMTTKQKVAQLKEQLKRKKAIIKGEITEDQIIETAGDVTQNGDESMMFDTSLQEQAEIKAGSLKDFIATGSRDKKIRIFESRTGRCVLTLVGHDNWITDLHFHPNGKFLISTADDRSIRIWDLNLGRCYRKIYNAHDHFISCFDMKGKLAVTGSVDTSAKVWTCR